MGCFFGVKHSNTASYGLLCLVVLNQVPISFIPILHLQRVALNQDTNDIWNDLTNREVNEHQLKHLSSFLVELQYVTLWITPKSCISEAFFASVSYIVFRAYIGLVLPGTYTALSAKMLFPGWTTRNKTKVQKEAYRKCCHYSAQEPILMKGCFVKLLFYPWGFKGSGKD